MCLGYLYKVIFRVDAAEFSLCTSLYPRGLHSTNNLKYIKKVTFMLPFYTDSDFYDFGIKKFS